MADMFSVSKQSWMSGISNTTWTLIIVFGLAFIVGMVFLVLWYKKYNKLVVVRKMVNGGVKIFNDKCRYLKDKEGVEWYKFLSLRKKVKIPSSECIDSTTMGLDHLECFLYPTGEIKWAKTKISDVENIIDPFTTEDRQTLQYQFWKSHLEGGINWKDLIIPIFGILALVVITVSLMIFYKDMGEPLLQMGDKLAGFQQQQTEMMKNMNIMLERLCSAGYGNCTQPIASSVNNIPTRLP